MLTYRISSNKIAPIDNEVPIPLLVVFAAVLAAKVLNEILDLSKEDLYDRSNYIYLQSCLNYNS